MHKRAGPLAEISLETGEISPTGMKIFPYKHSQAGWPAAGIIFCASAHAFVASRVYVKMAELRSFNSGKEKKKLPMGSRYD